MVFFVSNGHGIEGFRAAGAAEFITPCSGWTVDEVWVDDVDVLGASTVVSGPQRWDVHVPVDLR